MSASEKLKAIYEAACVMEPSDPDEVWLVDNDLAEAAVVALPQIVAVIEAAEKGVALDEWNNAKVFIQIALRDLDEALS